MPQNKVSNERSPGTFTLANIIIYVGALLIGWWIVTQWVAHKLGYQPQLGEPAFTAYGYPFYAPWKVLVWNYWYRIYATEIFNKAIAWVFVTCAVAIVFVIAYAVWQARRARVASTYGSSRWATPEEIKAAGLLDGSGVILGVTEDGQYLRHDGPENVAVVAPPRSHKGAGIIIPTLQTWEHSVVVNDIRRENWDASAGYRKRFSNVMYLNVTDPNSAHFNPLFEVRKGLRAIADVQNIADMIVDPDGTGTPSHWDKTSHALLVAAILHVLYAEKDKSLPGVAMFMAHIERDIIATLYLMLRTKHEDEYVHQAIASAARENLNRSPNELSGVMSTAMSFFGLYRDPIIAANIRDSDFRIEDLTNGKHPLSLYIVIPPSEINRTKPLRRLIWAQIGRKLMEDWKSPYENSQSFHRPTLLQEIRAVTEYAMGLLRLRPKATKIPAISDRRRVLFLVDEFPALGRMDFFETQLAYTGGYGIKTMLIAQSINQINKVYGNTNSILDLASVRVFFTPNDNETAEAISRATGEKTVVHQNKTYTGHRLAPWLSHVMVGDQETGRPLLDPGEVLRFNKMEEIIFIASEYPICARKIRYYEDEHFKARTLKPPLVDGTRPYPYRPKIEPTVWALLKPPVVPAAPDTAATQAKADDAAELDAPAPTNPDKPDAPTTEQEQTVEPSSEIAPEAEGVPLTEIERQQRAAFDEMERQRQARKHQQHDGREFDRSI